MLTNFKIDQVVSHKRSKTLKGVVLSSREEKGETQLRLIVKSAFHSGYDTIFVNGKEWEVSDAQY